jgi:hypothetical protein
MAVKFGAGDDRRGAYIAGSSGARQSGPLDVATGVADAFLAGLESNRDRFQGDRPEQFDDLIYERVSQDDQGNETRQYEVDKSDYQEKLEQIKNQEDAFNLINLLTEKAPYNENSLGVESLLDKNTLGYLKNTLANVGAFTTDPNEQRNVYQLLVNKMFQGDNDRMRGALPISQSAVEGLRRTGPTSFVDPALSQGFFGDVGSLFTGKNAAAVNLSDLPGGGIAELPNFGQAGLDFTKEQGFRNYGGGLEALVKAFTPAKYLDFILNPAKDALSMSGDLASATLEKITEPVDALAELIDSIGDDE